MKNGSQLTLILSSNVSGSDFVIIPENNQGTNKF